MATETVPADIAAAIDRYYREALLYGQAPYQTKPCCVAGVREAHTELTAAILAHLRKIDDLEAALLRVGTAA